MSQRMVRVNELLRREISAILHQRYLEEAVGITVTEVDTTPDLRRSRVYFSVLGNEAEAVEAERFFAREKREIRQLVGRNIVLKFLPHLEFIRDDSIERGQHLNRILDELGLEGDAPPPDEPEDR